MIIVIQKKEEFIEERNVHYYGKIVDYTWNDEKKSIKITLKNKKEKILLRLSYQDAEELNHLIQYGNVVSGEGSAINPENNTIPNTFNYRKYLKSLGISKVIETNKIKKEQENHILPKMKQKIRDILNQQMNSHYLVKLLLGVNEEGSEEAQEVFRKNGISHIFVISGMHLAFLYRLLQKIVKKISKKEYLSHIIPLIGLILYYSLISSSISSKRAFYFYGLCSINNLGKLNIKTKQIFYLVLGIIIFENPYVIYQIGFQYSFILAFSFLNFKSKGKNKYQKILTASCFAFLISLPITINHSFEINLWSIIINSIAIPFLTGIVFPGLLLSLFIQPLQYILKMFLHGFESINIFMTTLPCSSVTMSKMPIIIIGAYYLLLYLYLKSKKKWILSIIILGLMGWNMLPYWDKNAYIYFFDVGEGDSTLIISPKRKDVLLIDTGKENSWISQNIILFLKSKGIHKIDYLILSHGDNDHAGNAIKIATKLHVENIILNNGTKNKLEQEIASKFINKIKSDIKTSFIKTTDLKHSITKDENDNSRILHLCIYQTCTLFMGDASKIVEEEIIKRYHIQANILKVGHHGSKTSTSETLLKNISASDAIISTGRNNRYLHPHKEVIEQLKKYNMNITSTKESGTILIKINQKGYTFKTYPP